MVQSQIICVNNQGQLNEELRLFQLQYPKRKIIGVSSVPAECFGWYVTITYEVNI